MGFLFSGTHCIGLYLVIHKLPLGFEVHWVLEIPPPGVCGACIHFIGNQTVFVGYTMG